MSISEDNAIPLQTFDINHNDEIGTEKLFDSISIDDLQELDDEEQQENFEEGYHPILDENTPFALVIEEEGTKWRRPSLDPEKVATALTSGSPVGIGRSSLSHRRPSVSLTSAGRPRSSFSNSARPSLARSRHSIQGQGVNKSTGKLAQIRSRISAKLRKWLDTLPPHYNLTSIYLLSLGLFASLLGGSVQLAVSRLND